VTTVTEPLATLHATLTPHVPYSLDRNLRLQRLEHQVQALAAALRALTENTDGQDDEATSTVRKLLDSIAL
jgi:hypothetical protein